MKKIVAIISVGLSLVSSRAWAVQFSSVYTDLSKDCKSIEASKDAGAEGGDGEDIPETCKGFGDYTVSIDYSAFAIYVSIRNKKDADYHQDLPEQSNSETMRRKIEWRLADGVPFAVIYRAKKYSDKAKNTADGEEYMAKKYIIGESLFAIGLKGRSNFYQEIPVKAGIDANKAAMEQADAAF